MKKAGRDLALAPWSSTTACQGGTYRGLLCFLAIFSLALVLPARAPARDADSPPLPTITLSPSGALPSLAQVAAPEQPAPQPPTPLEPERPKTEKPPEALLLERGAILLPKGTLQIEPSFEYTYYSANRIAISGLTIFEAIIIGIIEVDSLKRNILTGALTARYGVIDRLQFDARVPFLYRQDQEILGVGTANQRERTTDNANIGDVEASLSWQALIGRAWVPDLILRADGRFPTGEDPFDIEREPVQGRPGELRLAKPPTGSGFYGAGPGLTAVWRTDPVVFFAGTRYTFNLSRDVGSGFGKIDPGDSLEWFVGLNLAVSERVSLNLSFVDKITWGTTQNGRSVPGSSFNDGRLVLGASIGLFPQATLVINAGVGLTQESPDFQFTVSVPFSFKLF